MPDVQPCCTTLLGQTSRTQLSVSFSILPQVRRRYLVSVPQQHSRAEVNKSWTSPTSSNASFPPKRGAMTALYARKITCLHVFQSSSGNIYGWASGSSTNGTHPESKSILSSGFPIPNFRHDADPEHFFVVLGEFCARTRIIRLFWNCLPRNCRPIFIGYLPL